MNHHWISTDDDSRIIKGLLCGGEEEEEEEEEELSGPCNSAPHLFQVLGGYVYKAIYIVGSIIYKVICGKYNIILG